MSRSEARWNVTFVKANASIQLAVTFLNQRHADPVSVSTSKIRWRSSDVRVAQVSASGLVTAVSNGRAVVTATETQSWRSLSDRVEVLVAIPEQ